MLTAKEKAQVESYQKQLNQPPWKFILVYGWTWAILVLIIMSLIELLFDKKSFQEQWADGLPLRIGVFLFGGLLYGLFHRVIIEKKFNELKKKDNRGGNFF